MDTAHEEDQLGSLGRLATYDPEDDKIRIRATERFDEREKETLDRLRFSWAPKQKLFVKHWSPQAQACALLLTGQDELELEAETPAQRAEAKAARLEALAHKRASQANEANDQVGELSENQGAILQGHHSQHKAEKEAKQLERAEEKAKDFRNAAHHWAYRAKATIRHEQRRQSGGMARRRIKTLRKDARKYQVRLNEARYCIALIEEAQGLPTVAKRRDRFQQLQMMLTKSYSSVITIKGDLGIADEMLEKNRYYWADQDRINGLKAWCRHLNDRANYFADQIGQTPYTGEITEVIVRGFAREFAVEQPKTETNQAGSIRLKTSREFPEAFRDLANGQFNMKAGEMTASTENWHEIFETMRYCPEPKRVSAKAAKPLLNYMPEGGHVLIPRLYSRPGDLPEIVEVREMTKEQYKRIPPDMKGTREPETGEATDQHRIRYTVGPGLKCRGFCVVLTNQKNHPEPTSLKKPKLEEAK